MEDPGVCKLEINLKTVKGMEWNLGYGHVMDLEGLECNRDRLYMELEYINFKRKIGTLRRKLETRTNCVELCCSLRVRPSGIHSILPVHTSGSDRQPSGNPVNS